MEAEEIRTKQQQKKIQLFKTNNNTHKTVDINKSTKREEKNGINCFFTHNKICYAILAVTNHNAHCICVRNAIVFRLQLHRCCVIASLTFEK